MWLASVSMKTTGGDLRPASMWSEHELELGTAILATMLCDVGDRDYERLFRMCATLCLHRGLHDEELEVLPTGCTFGLGRGIAGAPVHVYYSRGVPEGLASAAPCWSPGRNYLMHPAGFCPVTRRPVDRNRWPVWLPVDCGRCPPCEARAEIERGIGGARG